MPRLTRMYPQGKPYDISVDNEKNLEDPAASSHYKNPK